MTSQRRRGTSYYLTDECRTSLRRLADQYGVSQAAVIEIAVRTLESALSADSAGAALSGWIEKRGGAVGATPPQSGDTAQEPGYHDGEGDTAG